jgi:hypothetical protein
MSDRRNKFLSNVSASVALWPEGHETRDYYLVGRCPADAACREHLIPRLPEGVPAELMNDSDVYSPNRASQTVKENRGRGFISRPNNLQISAIAVRGKRSAR